jgi:hypothetical protein
MLPCGKQESNANELEYSCKMIDCRLCRYNKAGVQYVVKDDDATRRRKMTEIIAAIK